MLRLKHGHMRIAAKKIEIRKEWMGCYGWGTWLMGGLVSLLLAQVYCTGIAMVTVDINHLRIMAGFECL